MAEEAKLKEVKRVRPQDETALSWKCKCGNADVSVFLEGKRTSVVSLTMAVRCHECGESIGEIE